VDNTGTHRRWSSSDIDGTQEYSHKPKKIDHRAKKRGRIKKRYATEDHGKTRGKEKKSGPRYKNKISPPAPADERLLSS